MPLSFPVLTQSDGFWIARCRACVWTSTPVTVKASDDYSRRLHGTEAQCTRAGTSRVVRLRSAQHGDVTASPSHAGDIEWLLEAREAPEHEAAAVPRKIPSLVALAQRHGRDDLARAQKPPAQEAA